MILTVEADGDQRYINLPQEFLDQVGWKVGDTIIWAKKIGEWTMTKKEFNMFDVEQEIHKCWAITEALQVLLDYYHDLTEDQRLNLLIGYIEYYELRFNNLWNAFEQALKAQHQAKASPSDFKINIPT